MINSPHASTLNKSLLNHSKNVNTVMNNSLKGEIEQLVEFRNQITTRMDNIIMEVKREYAVLEEKSKIFESIANDKSHLIENKDIYETNNVSVQDESKIFKDLTVDSLKLVSEITNSKFYFHDLLSASEIPSEFLKNLSGKIPDNTIKLDTSIRLYSSQMCLSKQSSSVTELKGDISKLFTNNNINSTQLNNTQNNSTIDSTKWLKPEVKRYISPITEIKIPPLMPKQVRTLKRRYLDGQFEEILFDPKFDDIFNNLSILDRQMMTRSMKVFIEHNNYKLYLGRQRNDFLEKKIRLKYKKIMSFDFINNNGGVTQKTIVEIPQHNFRYIKMKIIPEDKDKFFQKIFPELLSRFDNYYYKSIGNGFKLYGVARTPDLITNFFYREALYPKHVNILVLKHFYFVEDVFKKLSWEGVDEHNFSDNQLDEMEDKILELQSIRKEYVRLVIERINKQYN